MKPRKLKSGSWNVRIMCNGTVYSFTDPDRKSVMRQASAFAAEYRENVQNPPLIKCLEDFITERSESLSPSTVRGYRTITRSIRARNPQIAQKRVIAVTDRDVQELIKKLKTPKTQRNYIGFIQAATGRRYNVKYMNKLPKVPNVPTELEVAGLIRIFYGTELEIPIMLGAYAGLRRGEICALTMDDLHGDYVRISKDMVLSDDGEWIVKPPKTVTSNRDVLLPHFVAERIRKKGRITTLTPNNITKRFLKRQASLDIGTPYTFHSLRHFYASYLHAHGVPDAHIMRAGGWSTHSSVMQTVYRHALDDAYFDTSQKAVDAFQNPFQN